MSRQTYININNNQPKHVYGKHLFILHFHPSFMYKCSLGVAMFGMRGLISWSLTFLNFSYQTKPIVLGPRNRWANININRLGY